MKNAYLLVLVTVSLTAFNAFGESEMDSEINDLQVRIVKIAPKPKAKPVARAQVTPKIYNYSARPAVQHSAVQRSAVRHAVQQQVVAPSFYKPQTISRVATVATVSPPTQVTPSTSETRHAVDENGNTNTFQPNETNETEQSTTESAPETISVKAPKSRSTSSNQLFRRVELLEAYTTSSFDGGDSSSLIPNGVSNQYNSSLGNAMLLTDVDFGNSQFFIESGFLITQMGSGTGEAFTNQSSFQQIAPTTEKVTLTYVGVPLNLKWRMAQDEHQSSFFAKAGAIPMYMMSHAYLSGSNLSYESRFGAYNTFDILFDLGVGYDINIGGGFHGIVDISAYQGILPVLTNYSVFNYGLMAGLGAAYVF